MASRTCFPLNPWPVNGMGHLQQQRTATAQGLRRCASGGLSL